LAVHFEELAGILIPPPYALWQRVLAVASGAVGVARIGSGEEGPVSDFGLHAGPRVAFRCHTRTVHPRFGEEDVGSREVLFV